eukprot:jgi/Chrpa1/20424/Chrysochromulina_OHIO_Genome00022752-RA
MVGSKRLVVTTKHVLSLNVGASFDGEVQLEWFERLESLAIAEESASEIILHLRDGGMRFVHCAGGSRERKAVFEMVDRALRTNDIIRCTRERRHDGTRTPVPPLAPSKVEHSEVDALRRAFQELFMMLKLRDAEICELKDQARCDRNAIERLWTRLSQEMALARRSMMDTALAASTQAISMLQEEQAIKDVPAEPKGAAVAKRGAGQPDLLRIVELPSEEVQALRARMQHTLRVELAAVEGRLEELEAAPTGAVLPRV